METKRPPVHSRTPQKCVGPYRGLELNMSLEDWDEVGRDAYNSGYNQISIFLTLQEPWPWPKLPSGKYNYLAINPVWEKQLYNMLERMAFWRITPHICFVNPYHNNSKDPFCQGLGNHIGPNNLNWPDDEALYSSWNGKIYTWLQWDEEHQRVYTNYRATSIFGRGMLLMINTVINKAKEVKELRRPNDSLLYQDFKISYKWGNETNAFVTYKDPKFPKGKITKKFGDRDEIFTYIRRLFIEAGFVNGINLYSVVDYLAFNDDELKNPPDMRICGNVSKDLNSKGFRLELHGIKTTNDIEQFVAHGVIPRSTLFSTDGDLRMVADYEGLGKSIYHTDLKLDTVPPNPFFPGDFLRFWRTYFPKYKDYIKDKNK